FLPRNILELYAASLPKTISLASINTQRLYISPAFIDKVLMLYSPQKTTLVLADFTILCKPCQFKLGYKCTEKVEIYPKNIAQVALQFGDSNGA
ncbi:MAG: hypothetical protein PV344_02405, partial [Anaplasma sp.]|nr:hypothetical protein [Anaplasma sp.]